MMTHTLSGREAGAIATRVRVLRRRKLLTAHQAALADVMLWTARKPGSGVLAASLAVLARLAGQARSTVAEGIATLERLGVIQRVRRRVRVAWIRGGQASRQLANLYRLRPINTESGARPVREQSPDPILVIEAPIGAVKAAQQALAARQKALEERWRARGGIG